MVFMKHDYGFDAEFMSEDELEEMMDSAILSLGELIAEDEKRTSIINPDILQNLVCVYKAMKYISKGTNAKVTYKLHEPYNSMGVVSVIGHNLIFKNSKWLMKAIALSSNYEVYPKNNGTVQMNFTFHGLTTSID
jgi:hypothetical protein